MPNINFRFAFKLPPKRAIEYFRKKLNAPSWNYYDTWQRAHTKAFVVAKVTRLDILKDIRNAVDKALSEGITFHEFQKNLKPILEDKGWWGKKPIGGKEVQLGSPWRLKTIYLTNLKTAYSAGRYKAMMDNVQFRPYWQYMTRDDNRVRQEHKILHGKVFHYTDPFWLFFYPPNGWRCRCYVVALKDKNLKRDGLTVTSSKGLLSSEKKPISPGSEIKKPVAVFKDPITGKKISPDPAWNYNPGREDWKPDLTQYPKDLLILFNEDGTYNLNPKEVRKVEAHISKIKETFKEWGGWNVTAKYFYDPTDEEFYKVREKDISNPVIAFHKENKIYIRTDITLDFLGIASEKNQIRALLTFVHETLHSIRNTRFLEWAQNNSLKEIKRVQSIGEGLTELLTNLWGVKYGGFTPEQLAPASPYQKVCANLLLQLAEKFKGDKKAIREEIKKTLTFTVEEMKDWAKGIDSEVDYKKFLPVIVKYGIIKKGKNLYEGANLWILEN